MKIITKKTKFLPSRLMQQLRQADKTWRCKGGDNPACELDDSDIEDIIKNCASNQQYCNASCGLYRVYINFKDEKLGLDLNGRYYVRVISSKEELVLRFQKIKPISEL